MLKPFYRSTVIALSAAAALTILPMTTHAQVAGSSSGSFSNPQAGKDNATPNYSITSDVFGTDDTITWGKHPTVLPNSLVFHGNTYSSPYETPFNIGTITYHNGSTNGGTNIDSVNLGITLDFTNPAIGNKTFNFTVDMFTTPNSSNAVTSADYIDLSNVFSNETITVGANTYHLKITGFQNFTGDSVSNADLRANGITPMPNRYYVYEDTAGNGHTGTGSADLYAELTTQAVPEASTLLGFASLLGLGGGALLRRRRAR